MIGNTVNTVNTLERRISMLELDLRSRVPIYEQLINKFKELMIREILKADEQLPSVRTLAKELTINPNTIQKAYKELERQGYIYSIQGKGSFVTPSAKIVDSEKLDQLKEKLHKVIREAIYFGMRKEQIIDIVSQVDALLKGGGKK
jgi:GntR family transcriptional regulator